MKDIVQRSAKVDAPGLVNFVPTLAYNSCLNMPPAFTQPGASTLADGTEIQEELRESQRTGSVNPESHPMVAIAAIKIEIEGI